MLITVSMYSTPTYPSLYLLRRFAVELSTVFSASSISKEFASNRKPSSLKLKESNDYCKDAMESSSSVVLSVFYSIFDAFD